MTNGTEPDWSIVSRDATEACLKGRNQRALSLITESINIAEKSPGVPLRTLLALRCKQCQILYALSRKKEAQIVARSALNQLSGDDWRQQITASRFLEIERVCFLENADYSKALKAAELLSSLEAKIMGPNSLEAMRRRIRLIEVIFMHKDFDRVVMESVKIEKFFRSIGLSPDADEALLLIYLGTARLQIGQLEAGRKDLQRACEISESSRKPPVPGWVRDYVNSMPQAQEIHSLLKKAW